MGKPTVVIASHNAGKISEFKALLGNRFEIASVDFPDVEETGNSYYENSLLKAFSTFESTGLPVLADDSGLSLADLGGAPGIYSARYAGKHGDWEANRNKILSELKKKNPLGPWIGEYVCCLTYLDSDGPLTTYGYCRGEFREEAVGDNGFGYDPHFYPSTENASMAQIHPRMKNLISHRALAVNRLLSLMG